MTGDSSRGVESARVGAGMVAGDSIRWSPLVRVDKYEDDMRTWLWSRHGIRNPQGEDYERLGIKPYESLEAAGNLLTTAGLNRLTSLLIGAGGQAATATATRLGVGNSSTAAAVGQTDLQASAGSGNRQFKVMDSTYPQQANGVVTLRSTFATGEANFVWAEWGSDIGTPTVTNGTTVNTILLNRAVQALGTKASGDWVLTATITIS